MGEGKIVGVTTAAVMLGVAEQTVRRLADTGSLRCVRGGGSLPRRLFLVDDVEAFRASRREQLSPEGLGGDRG